MGIFDFLSTKQPVDLDALQGRQDDLQGAYNAAQTDFNAAKTRLAKKKNSLVEFNNQYGRVLQLLTEE